MSASREKKNRQELAAQGFVDPKIKREAKERAEKRKTTTIAAVATVLFIAVAAVVLVYNSGILSRNAKALSIDGVEYSATEVDFYYYAAYNNASNSQYGSYMELDSSLPLDEQEMADMAKLVLGVESERTLTWDEYLKETAQKNMVFDKRMYEAATAEGEDDHAGHIAEEVEATIEAIEGYAKQSGYSTKSYLQMAYGKNMTTALFRQLVERSTMASHYASHYAADLTYSEADLEAYYGQNKEHFDVVGYESLVFSGTPEAKTDADGNAVEATEEEIAAAKAAAAADAAAVQARLYFGETLEAVAKDYEGKASYTSSEGTALSGSALADWLYGEGRVAGENTVINEDPASTVAVFHSRNRHDYNTIDVRHILVQVDESGLDNTAETYEADKQALWDEAKAEAEQILADWQAGEATEETFGEMAAQLSDDGADHGLYEQVYKGQMVEAFENWCFDAARAVGDTGIVETPYGYHVMYFVGTNAPYWQVQVRSIMADEDYAAWESEMIADASVEVLDGMKYVG